MSKICIDCGVTKKSNKGERCRLCANRKTCKDENRNKKISIANKGRTHSQETKEKIRTFALERFKDKRNHPSFGRKISEETREKMRIGNTGEKNPQWKGGRIKNNKGYIWIYCPDHPNGRSSSLKNYVLEHRLVMEKKIGRYLTKDEIIHHINGVRDDNRIENLVITTASKHVAEHNTERIWGEKSKLKLAKNANNRNRNNGKFAKNNQ